MSMEDDTKQNLILTPKGIKKIQDEIANMTPDEQVRWLLKCPIHDNEVAEYCDKCSENIRNSTIDEAIKLCDDREDFLSNEFNNEQTKVDYSVERLHEIAMRIQELKLFKSALLSMKKETKSGDKG